jgi:hypothetical protein
MALKQKPKYPLAAYECVLVAGAAGVTPRLVHAAVNLKKPGKPVVRARLRAALEARGLAHLLPE